MNILIVLYAEFLNVLCFETVNSSELMLLCRGIVQSTCLDWPACCNLISSGFIETEEAAQSGLSGSQPHGSPVLLWLQDQSFTSHGLLPWCWICTAVLKTSMEPSFKFSKITCKWQSFKALFHCTEHIVFLLILLVSLLFYLNNSFTVNQPTEIIQCCMCLCVCVCRPQVSGLVLPSQVGETTLTSRVGRRPL